MTIAEQKMRTLLTEAAELGLPADDFADLVHAAMTGSPIETVMRIRALTELSAHADAATLMMLAAAASERRGAINDLVQALGGRMH